jgi:4,5-dihydroxyphthalate decarboxylase
MSKVTLTLSCGKYDRTLPLFDGRVVPEGFQLSIVPPVRPGTPLGNPEADVYECSLTALILEQRERYIMGLPIFPRRRFFHQSILIRRESDISGFEDLVGKKIGLRWYHYALGVWLRGYLSDEFGIAQNAAEWYIENRSVVPAPGVEAPRITTIPKDKSLTQMLVDGELDVLAHEDSHRIILENPSLRRLIPDFKIAESSYFENTGFFPINHVLVIKRQIANQHPWILTQIVEAFEEAKRICLAALESDNTLVSSPWIASLLEDHHRLLKREIFVYGLEPNRKELSTYLRYFWDQRLIPTVVSVEQLFAPSA